MKKEFYLLFSLLFLLLAINYSAIDSYLIKTFKDYEIGLVERVIDGDTIEINGTSVRLLGINSPERGEPFHKGSKEFLEKEILNKSVELHFGRDKVDKYRRKLAYIIYENKNINLESVKQGYSNYHFPNRGEVFYKKFKEAWEECLQNNINLCEQSDNICIILEKWDVENQKVILKNNCNKSINLKGWTIKNEGRKKYEFQNQSINPKESITITKEDFDEDYIWINLGDSIFIRDKENKLVIFESY